MNKPQRRPEHAATGRRRLRRGGEHAPARQRAEAATQAGPTAVAERDRRLEEVVLTTWAALVAGHPVECPVCGGPLTAAHGCSRCGSRLS